MTGGLLCGQRPRSRNSSEAMPVNLVTALQLREVSDMAHSKSSPGIVTAPLPDSGVLWLDLVFQMDKLNGAIRRFDALIKGNPPSHVARGAY
jgi:hypothetical protein